MATHRVHVKDGDNVEIIHQSGHELGLHVKYHGEGIYVVVAYAENGEAYKAASLRCESGRAPACFFTVKPEQEVER